MIKMNIESMEKKEFITHLLKFETIFLNQGKCYEMIDLIDEYIEKHSIETEQKNDLLLIKAFYLEMGKYYEKALEIYKRLGNYIACARVFRALGRIKEALRYEEKEREGKTRYMKHWCI
jgi:tetratricopeptide (TPR) repeat protein